MKPRVCTCGALDTLDTLDRCAALDNLDIFEVLLEGVVFGGPAVDCAYLLVGGAFGFHGVEVGIPAGVGEEVL